MHLCVVFKILYHRLHILGQWGFKLQELAADRVTQGEGIRMECLTVDKLGYDFLAALTELRIIVFVVTRITVKSAVLEWITVAVQMIAQDRIAYV